MTTSGNSDRDAQASDELDGVRPVEPPEAVDSDELPKAPAVEEPVMPTAAEEAAARPDIEVPRVVRYALWAWVVSTLLAVSGAVLVFVMRDALIDEAIKANTNKDFTPDLIRSSITNYSWLLLVGTITVGALGILCAYKARQGTAKGRGLLTVVALFGALFQYFIGRFTIFGPASSLFALLTLLLLFLPSASAYYKAIKRAR